MVKVKLNNAFDSPASLVLEVLASTTASSPRVLGEYCHYYQYNESPLAQLTLKKSPKKYHYVHQG